MNKNVKKEKAGIYSAFSLSTQNERLIKMIKTPASNNTRYSVSEANSQEKTLNKERKGYDPIDRKMWCDPNLSGSLIKVLGYLVSNSKDFNPSIRAISKMVCLTVKTVSRALRKLEKLGYISVFKRKGMLTLYNILKSPIKKILSTTEVQKTVVHSTPHSNSKHKDKHITKCNVDNIINDLSTKPDGMKSTCKKLGFKLSKLFHKNLKHDFNSSNEFYGKLVLKYGKEGYEALKAYGETSGGVKFNTDWTRYITRALPQELAK